MTDFDRLAWLAKVREAELIGVLPYQVHRTACALAAIANREGVVAGVTRSALQRSTRLHRGYLTIGLHELAAADLLEFERVPRGTSTSYHLKVAN